MRTYFIDIDGVLVEHEGKGACNQWRAKQWPSLLSGARQFLDAIEKDGAYVVLTTSRKESCRADLSQMLRSYNIFFDVLLMGLPHGERILINDTKSDESPSARAFVVSRNAGLGGIKL